MVLFEKEKTCPNCGVSGSAFRIHPAGSEECSLPEQPTDHTHRHCETCSHEWADAPPHIRKRDLPPWALEPEQ